MKYYNLKNRKERVSFRDAAERGISSDMGLFMPERIPTPEAGFFRRLPGMSLPQVAAEIGLLYTGEDIPPDAMQQICNEAFDFPVVLRQLDERRHVLELFHGPTGAFKDIGARFMAGCFGYFSTHDNRRRVVLVATSGDTGGAIASGFLGVEGVDVIILYPSGRVSSLQENQMTTPGGNITALEVEGTFDQCQMMAKSVLAVGGEHKNIRLTSANSINIARLVPQTFYYYYALGRLGADQVLSVPSGNFGNITAAAMAWRSGLRMKQLIAATNINRVVPEYLKSGIFTPAESITTIANAMDVGNPGNFDRFRRVFDDDFETITASVTGYWYDDDAIREQISKEYERSGYILDPHGAVAGVALDNYLADHPGLQGVFVATAHPAKFADTVEPLTGKKIDMPPSLMKYLSGEKQSVTMRARTEELEEYLNETYGTG